MKGVEKLGGLLNIIYFLNREESFKTSFLKKKKVKKEDKHGQKNKTQQSMNVQYCGRQTLRRGMVTI